MRAQQQRTILRSEAAPAVNAARAGHCTPIAFSMRRATARSRAAAGRTECGKIGGKIGEGTQAVDAAEKNSNLSNLSDLSAVAACTAISRPAGAGIASVLHFAMIRMTPRPHPAMSRHYKPAREPIGIGDERSVKKTIDRSTC
jgi:hypothetical protein